ncbi:MDR family MFS transporter [Aspergillus homomorphus CBS 101889]|uniref:Permease of the major facilitator superfamily n=1 Tax=Aspergillus homomorphus (strain CBS 101889) TaxID=1450537 RepID=A0A395HIU3_ASPHC|nr:permease of the major facilitator superfamily [Aspergillus homomorphus CBS 101889]RAL07449.1 permease of the major facilitator superfamily [Aspergillus homomorphus CBS 101889]
MGPESISDAGVHGTLHTSEKLEAKDESHEEDIIEYPTGIKLVVVLVAIFSSLILTGLDFNMIATALPTITADFHTIADVGWYYSAYRLTSCAFQFMFGKLYHLFSAKCVFLASVLIFELGSLLAGVAPTSSVLILGRAVSGIGCSGIISGVLTIIARSFPLRKRPLYTGLAAALEGISSTVAPMLGGLLTQYISWRWCFYINLPLGGLSFILILLFFQDPLKTKSTVLPWRVKLKRLDLLGAGLFVPSITFFLLALQWGGTEYAWNNVRVIVLFALSGVLLIAFIWQEKREGDNALLPGRVMRSRSVLAGMWFGLCNNSSLSVFEYYMPTYFQAVRGVSATISGVLCLPIVVGLILSILVGSSLTSAIGYYTPFMIITAVLSPIAAGLLTTLQTEQSLASLICYQALLGVGTGIGFQGPQVAVQTVLPVADAPTGIALIIFAQNFGPAVFVSIAQTIFTGELRTRLGEMLPSLGTQSLTQMGFSDIEQHVAPADIPRVIEGYVRALTTAYFLPVGLACCLMVGALGMEWRSVKK